VFRSKRLECRAKRRRSHVAAAAGIAVLTLGCSGGGGGIFGPEEALTYTASTRVLIAAPTTFETSVTLTNSSTAVLTVSVLCGPHIIVFATADRTGTAVFGTGPLTNCSPAPVSLTLQPGATKTYSATATTSQVLGASGAEGTYYIVALMAVGNTTAAVSAGQVELRR